MILYKATFQRGYERLERITASPGWGLVRARRIARRFAPKHSRLIAICSQGVIALLLTLSAFGQPMPPVVAKAPVTNYFAVSAVRLDGVESAWSGVVSSTNASVTLAWDYGNTSTLAGFNLYHGRSLDKMTKQPVGLTLTAHWPHISVLNHREYTVTANVGLQTTDPKAPALFYTLCSTSNFHDWFPVGTTGQITIRVRSY